MAQADRQEILQTAPLNAMSVDVEDYFQVQAFAGRISRADWDSMPHRVEQNTDRVLGIFDDAGIKATFFTLGWVAERYPALIRRIVDQGHELASHGMAHFRADELRGGNTTGCRAPGPSVRPGR